MVVALIFRDRNINFIDSLMTQAGQDGLLKLLPSTSALLIAVRALTFFYYCYYKQFTWITCCTPP